MKMLADQENRQRWRKFFDINEPEFNLFHNIMRYGFVIEQLDAYEFIQNEFEKQVAIDFFKFAL